jgi:general secretion pathway protein D
MKVLRHANYFEPDNNDRDDSTEDDESYCRDCEQTGDVVLETIPASKKVVGFQVVDEDAGDIPNRVPIIQERELESVLSLRDGQIAVLGGLIQDVMAEEDTGIPGLVSAPTAGFLFGQRNKAKRKSELVVFLKPTLVAAR